MLSRHPREAVEEHEPTSSAEKRITQSMISAAEDPITRQEICRPTRRVTEISHATSLASKVTIARRTIFQLMGCASENSVARLPRNSQFMSCTNACAGSRSVEKLRRVCQTLHRVAIRGRCRGDLVNIEADVAASGHGDVSDTADTLIRLTHRVRKPGAQLVNTGGHLHNRRTRDPGIWAGPPPDVVHRIGNRIGDREWRASQPCGG